MRNSTFNILLIVLIIFDNTFIIFAMLDYACVRGGEIISLSAWTSFWFILIYSFFLANIDEQQCVRPAIPAVVSSQQHRSLLLHRPHVGHQH